MSLSRKILLSFAGLLVLIAGEVAFSIVLLARLVDQSTLLVSPTLEQVDALAHAEADLQRLRTLEYAEIWENRSAVRDQNRQEMADLRADIERWLASYAAQQSDRQLVTSAMEITARYHQYTTAQLAVLAAVDRGDRDAALRSYLGYQPSFIDLDTRLHALRHEEYRQAEQLRNHLVDTALNARWLLSLAAVAITLVSAGLGWHLYQRITTSLSLLVSGAHRIAREEFDVPVPLPPEQELAVLAGALNTAMAALAARRVERERLEEERQHLARTRLGLIVQAQENERARISRELHDEAGQALTALRYGLGRVRHHVTDPTIVGTLDWLIDLTAEIAKRLGTLARDLRPSVLDELGLVPALRSYVYEFSGRVDLPVELTVRGTLPSLPAVVETTVFRVVQEALTNVARHAHASHAHVELAADADRIRIAISDDGQGFDPAAVASGNCPSAESAGGLGLIGIRERVELLGGHLAITSATGSGTRLLATIPLADASAALAAARTDSEVART
jgi:signal transduction histidine kinase